jgi:acetyl-CoA carboxylase biotin carboxyl carrier protein
VKIDLEQIKVLLDMVSKTEIAELTIEVEDERVTIKKPLPASAGHGPGELHLGHYGPVKEAQVFQVPSSGPSSSRTETKEDNGNASNLVAITAPMVGTFYRASSPTANPYVDVGDKISVGQTICIIEAMKLMNDLPSEVAGKVIKVCADNGATVEFGQQLFLVDPNG